MRILSLKSRRSLSRLLDQLRPKQAEAQRGEGEVRAILKAVQREGDRALLRLTRRFDRYRATLNRIRVSPTQIKHAYEQVSRGDVEHLRRAADRIRDFHERQKTRTFLVETPGSTLGQLVRPLDTVGVYVPGGKAAYPSSVLMNVIPAKVAGVPRVVMCSPTPGGDANPYLLVAADIAGVTEIYTVGGAQAIGAMAYGTKTIPRVDKIVGPGNLYVALAKKLVFGVVGIDMLAGPSEIVVVADDSAPPAFIVADLLSQAEHDELAISILITPSTALIRAVRRLIPKQMAQLARRQIIATSLKRFGAILKVSDLNEAIEAANIIAPEHLELAVEQPYNLLPGVKHAGAVFLGHYTPESLGDYAAGPNHVLPTGGTARFSSPLSVEDFMKKTSLISFSKQGLSEIRDTVIRIAQMEGFQAHARAVEVRLP
ncbi:MAG TPA: histidinol dehydrogenase [Nitrospiria bacterium]|nr:histidinol dehydrogenase [Nitrospiria bacterium]